MAVHTFAQGEHDEFVCGHILKAQAPTGPVVHTQHPDGTVEVDFPGLSAQDITDALATYDRDDYIGPPPSLAQKVSGEAANDAALRLLLRQEITGGEYTQITSRPAVEAPDYPAPF